MNSFIVLCMCICDNFRYGFGIVLRINIFLIKTVIKKFTIKTKHTFIVENVYASVDEVYGIIL